MLINYNIKLLVVHCSDSENNKNITAIDIHKMHLNFGWDGIGYHKIICRSGKIENGRPEFWKGAHVKGHNKGSIGICYIGGVDEFLKPKDTRTPEQKESLLLIIRALKKMHPNATIHGHNEFANKACPCFNVEEEYCDI